MDEFPLTFFPCDRKTRPAERVSASLPDYGERHSSLRPFHLRRLADGDFLGVSLSGDYAYFGEAELARLLNDPCQLPYPRRAALTSRFFIANHGLNKGADRLLASRRGARRETVTDGPALHILVTTLQCGHTCKYCQVSRSLDDHGFSMSAEMVDAACARIWESRADVLTVEFQGGDPLLRFDLIVQAIATLERLNHAGQKRLRFVVASTLHQLDEEMCSFFRAHKVYLSTSLDGPGHVHDKNRPVPGKNSYQRTLTGIALARREIGPNAVSALMTTTRASLDHPEEIVDEYVAQGFHEIFLRPLSFYGFAKRNISRVGYSLEEFQAFYSSALERILWWNRRGVPLREVYLSIILNKILSTFDAGYVDLQSPTGAGSSVLVYNYDGWVYPSDEARMLVETGDTSLRMGQVDEPLERLIGSETRARLVAASHAAASDCVDCSYQHYCAPNPVDSQAQYGRADVPARQTEHCGRHLWLFDTAFALLKNADPDTEALFHAWAQPSQGGEG
jgi:His-Xaa-Ser system radical SAM maturase HxsB